MLLRIFLLLICLAATGWYLHEQQHAGHLRRVDELFLDFLAANARERLTLPETQAEDQVVFVRIREEEAAEYASWPPPPLDWQTILKSLHPYAPSVVVIATPLTWGRPAPDFVPAVTDALLPFTSTVLGIEAELAAADRAAPAFMGDLESALPRFQHIDGDARAVPPLAALITAPDKELRNQAELGVLAARRIKDRWLLPYAVRDGETLIPTALAQALSRHSRSPYASQRLRLGPGAAAYLREGLFVPLEPSGELPVAPAQTVATVNALNLMTGALADGTDAADKQALGRGRVIVVGFDRDLDSPAAAPTLARLHAQALAGILALPRLRVLPQTGQWLAWAAAGLAAVWLMLRVRRRRALLTGALLIFLALLASFLLFQSRLLWFPPAMPAALILTGTLLTALIGRKNVSAKADSTAEVEPAPKAES